MDTPNRQPSQTAPTILDGNTQGLIEVLRDHNYDRFVVPGNVSRGVRFRTAGSANLGLVLHNEFGQQLRHGGYSQAHNTEVILNPGIWLNRNQLPNAGVILYRRLARECQERTVAADCISHVLPVTTPPGHRQHFESRKPRGKMAENRWQLGPTEKISFISSHLANLRACPFITPNHSKAAPMHP